MEVSVRSRKDLVLTEKHPPVEEVLKRECDAEVTGHGLFSASTLQIALIWKDKEVQRCIVPYQLASELKQPQRCLAYCCH